jgi:hypothetical protein
MCKLAPEPKLTNRGNHIMSDTQTLKIGQRFYDCQITANVIVLEPHNESNRHYPKCMVESSSAEYVARIDALQPPKVLGDKIDLMEKALTNHLKDLTTHTFHDVKLGDMCDSASRDDINNIALRNHYKEHPLWALDIDYIKKGDIELHLKYLLVHGFKSECIFSQAGK